MSSRTRWSAGAVTIVVCCCVLSFYQSTADAQRSQGPAKPPFASAVEQRFETINELKNIGKLLKEQNELLKEQNGLLRAAFPDAAKKTRR